MSVSRLLFCGLLVASGLILAAFTLHGAFDGRPVGAASAVAGPALKPWSTNTFGAKGGLVAVSADAPEPGSSKAQPPQTDAKAAKKKRRTAKRPAEPTQKARQQPQQQTASQWPWSWFGN